MTQAYTGQIQIFPYTFAPRSWAWCNGQLMSISQNTALFSIVGTRFGGDGRTTFGLPAMAGRVPVGYGQGRGLSPYEIGQHGGLEGVTLLTDEMPRHSHSFNVSTRQALGREPANQLFAVGKGIGMYTGLTGAVTFSPQAAGIAGQSAAHNNMQSFVSVNYCIALEGVYPKRPTAMKATAKKATRKKAAAKKPAARTTAAKKPAAKKTATRATSKKPASKRTSS
jgi:microcystin-dependent protein